MRKIFFSFLSVQAHTMKSWGYQRRLHQLSTSLCLLTMGMPLKEQERQVFTADVGHKFFSKK
jgi:hypothetical protein